MFKVKFIKHRSLGLDFHLFLFAPAVLIQWGINVSRLGEASPGPYDVSFLLIGLAGGLHGYLNCFEVKRFIVNKGWANVSPLVILLCLNTLVVIGYTLLNVKFIHQQSSIILAWMLITIGANVLMLINLITEFIKTYRVERTHGILK